MSVPAPGCPAREAALDPAYRDFRTSVELRSGLVAGETIVLSLPVLVGEGGKVKPAGDGAAKAAR